MQTHELAEELLRQVTIKERLIYWLLALHRGKGDPRGWDDAHEEQLNGFLDELGYESAGDRADRMLELGEPGRHAVADARIDRILAHVIRVEPIPPCFPRLHPRHTHFRLAKLSLSEAVAGWLDRNPRLTFAEIVHCLSNEVHVWSGHHGARGALH